MESLNATAQTALANKAIVGPAPSSTARQTKQAAQDFEGMFLAEMLKPVFATVEVDKTFGGGHAEEMWRGVLVEEYAKQISKTGGVGIAPMIEEQLLKMQEAANGPR